MKLTTNASTTLAEHQNFKRKVPRLKVVRGIAQVNANDKLQRKWFEEFKK